MERAAWKGVLVWNLLFRSVSGADWPHYLGDQARTHYSRLDQVNRENVARLDVAWTYRGSACPPGARTQIQCNPIVIDGIVYATTANQVLVALDGTTGRERWRFDPRVEGTSKVSDPRHRGVVFWQDGANGRVLLAHDRYLYAMEAETGRLVTSFGDGGAVDFSRHLGRDETKFMVGSGTPGVVYENLYILATRTSEVTGAAPGHVLAFDLRTGDRAWIFHTIPQPGEFGHDTWPAEAWKSAGGANCWAGMALDSQRGLVYVPTGSASYDFWGGARLGQNLFANSLVCLDARTGRRKWHYQIVRHDLWDRDLPAPPTLHTVTRNGVAIPAVAQITKSGHVFVFHRETGEPLFPIVEQPAPPSDLEGEIAAQTQPIPEKPAPFSRQSVNYDGLTRLSPESNRHALLRFARLRPSVPFQPPTLEGTVVAPGQDGGGQWGGAAVDPGGIMVVNGSDTPGIVTMVDTRPEAARERGPGATMYLQFCAGCHGADRRGAPQQNISSLAGLEARLTREQVLEVLANGRGAMPGFKFLSEPELADLADHVLGRPVPAASDASPVARTGHRATTSFGAPYGHVFERWEDAEGYPAVQPPWGTLNAIDLNTGEYLWRVPLGEIQELRRRGLPPTGTNNYGGPIVTAGGLAFIAATPDQQFRAFDLRSGKVLWQRELPAAGYATPCTYSVNGRQFILLACGGGKLGSPSSDTYVAFALRE